MCAAKFLCALDVFARHTSSRITFLTLTIVGRSRGDVSSHQDVFQTFGFPEGQYGWFFEDFAQFWVFLYGCPVLTHDVGYITERRMVCDDKCHSVVRVLFFILDEVCQYPLQWLNVRR